MYINKSRVLSVFACIVAMMAVFTSCKEKKTSTNIITHKQKVVKQKSPQKMGDINTSFKVDAFGGSYTVNTILKADTSLAKAKDGNTIYYDNTVNLRIIRKDGSEFFNRTFRKADFDRFLTEDVRRNGAMLGIVFVDVEGDDFVFAASVGSPDKSSDEYIPMILKVSRTGKVSISRDNNLDTSSDTPDESAEDEDGV